MNNFIYADNAATTKVSDTVFEAMKPWLFEKYGNPSSIYAIGREAHAAVDKARRQVASVLGCQPVEVFFTSGGSEADNWAIKGTVERLKPRGKNHIITTNFEHHAVLHTCAALEKQGYEVTYLPVDEFGLVTPEQVKAAIRPQTAIVSIMYANNEIGTIEPIKEIGAVCHEAGVLFHTDAVQAVGHLPIDIYDQNIDMLSLSAHKFHGPKGVGALIVRKGPMPTTLIDGGGQERGRRAGTENISAIVGLGVAIVEANEKIAESTPRLLEMRDRLITELLKLPKVRLNGHRTKRLPGNVNLSFEGIEGESLLLSLDNAGICASSGSACTSGSLDPSHVLLAIGLPHEVAHGSLRLTFGDTNTMEDVDAILERIPPIVERLRAMSPVWETMMKSE